MYNGIYPWHVAVKRKIGYWLWERAFNLMPDAEKHDLSNWVRFGASYCPGNYDPWFKKYRVNVEEVTE